MEREQGATRKTPGELEVVGVGGEGEEDVTGQGKHKVKSSWQPLSQPHTSFSLTALFASTSSRSPAPSLSRCILLSRRCASLACDSALSAMAAALSSAAASDSRAA